MSTCSKCCIAKGRSVRRDIRCLRSNNYTITTARRLLPIAVESAGWSLISSRALCGAALATAAVKIARPSGESPQVCPHVSLGTGVGSGPLAVAGATAGDSAVDGATFFPPLAPTRRRGPSQGDVQKAGGSGVASVGRTTSGGGVALSCEDPLAVPRVQAEGAYGNGPIRERVQRAGFQLPVPSRSKAQPGVGAIRNAVERCHNGFAQCGRVFRRCDRSARHSLGCLELAACIILLRAGFVS